MDYAIVDSFEINELIDLLKKADQYCCSEYCSRKDERKIEEICADTYRLISHIMIDGLTKEFLRG